MIIIDYKYLNKDQREWVDSDDMGRCRTAAWRGWGLDKLVNDCNKEVRRAVAEQERDEDLDILVHDKTSFVREYVAECLRPQDLDALVEDR